MRDTSKFTRRASAGASSRRTRLAPLTGKSRKGPAKAKDAEAAGPAAGAKPASADPGRDRIAKVIARAGACSRRDAEAMIADGRVTLNGAALTSPATTVGPDDRILIDGAPLAERARTRLFLFHKPRGLVTTDRDPEGRETVFDYVRRRWPDAPRVVSIGRLDINTEGLLLLTNDGGLARVLELPSTGWVRRYRVRAKGAVDQAALDRLRHGITVEGVDYAEIEATLDRRQGANCWLTMGLREGKNREIKRVLEHLGLEVNRLIRLSFGPFQLSALAEGALEEVRTRVLRDQLGPALAQASGADFSGPAAETPAGARETSLPGRAPAARTRPARTRAAPMRRRHVSALREEAMESGGARKRTERSETADRRGRAVQVERRVAATSREQNPPARAQRTALADPAPKAPRGGAAKEAAANGERVSPRSPAAGRARPKRDLERRGRTSGEQSDRQRGQRPAGAADESAPRDGRVRAGRPNEKTGKGSVRQDAATPRRSGQAPNGKAPGGKASGGKTHVGKAPGGARPDKSGPRGKPGGPRGGPRRPG